MGDNKEFSNETVEGLQEDKEPVPNRIDTWARATIPVQQADPDYMTEREMEEKRIQRAQEFIANKNPKAEPYVPGGARRGSALGTELLTPPDSFRPRTVPEQKAEKNKKIKLELTEAPPDPVAKKEDNEMRTRKAFELKEQRDLVKRKNAEKEQKEAEEAKKHKLKFEVKSKAYTYDYKGNITFLNKDGNRLPDVPKAKPQIVNNEETKVSPYYEHFSPLKDANELMEERAKNYKELNTDEFHENSTITVAERDKPLQVFLECLLKNSQILELLLLKMVKKLKARQPNTISYHKKTISVYCLNVMSAK